MIRHLIYTILILSVTQAVTAQKDFQMEADTPYHRLQVFLNDTTAGSPTYGLGSWGLVDSVKGAFQDYDFYGLGTGRAPEFGEDSIETAWDIIYVKFDSARIHSYTPNYNNWFPWSQTSMKNTSGSGYMGHRHINFDSLAFPALSEPYGRFGEWIENTSWDNSINTGFEDGGNMIHNFGFNYDLGAANYNALRPNFKWSVEQSYYPGSGSSMWVESHWEMMDTLGRVLRPISIAAAYDGSYAAFSATSDRTTIFQSPDQITGDGKWQDWDYPTGTDDMWYNYHGRINKEYTGTVLEKFSNLRPDNAYRNIITHDADDDLWLGDSTGIDITNKLRFRINSFATPLIKSNNYTLQFDTVVVNFLGDNNNIRNFTIQKPGDSDKMLFGFDGASMNIGKYNDDEQIITIHSDAPNYSIFMGSNGKLGLNKSSSSYAGIDLTQQSDDLAGGMRFIEADQSAYTGLYHKASDDFAFFITGGEKFLMMSNGKFNASQYDATPITGTPFRLLAHETDGDYISATWAQVIDSLELNGISGTGDDWGADVVNHDLTLTGDGTVGSILKVDTSEIATQYDLTLISSGSTDLTIGGAGPTYTIESSAGTDVTISAAGILALSESPANTLVFTATEVDGSITNEGALTVNAGTGTTSLIHSNTSGSTDVTLTAGTGLSIGEAGNVITLTNTVTDTDTDDQGLTITGAGPTYTIDIDGGSDVIISAAGINTLSESPANTLVITGTEVDGSTTNETNTIEEGNVSAQTGNLNLDFQTLFDIATDGGTEVNISLDLSEATTVTTAEADDYMIMHDAGSSQHQKMLWADFLIDLISFYDGASLQGTGNAIDVGEGLDINMVSAEANINLDASEFLLDGTNETDESFLVYDPDTTAGHRIQRIPWSDVVGGSGDGNGIYDGDGTTPTDVDVTMTDNIRFGTTTNNDLFIDGSNDRVGIGTGSPGYGLHVFRDSGAAVESETAGTGGLVFKLEGKADGGGVNTDQAGIIWAYTDADYAAGVEQNAASMTLHKESDAAQWSTLKLTMNEATDASFVFEKNADFTNTTESHLAINAGMAYTQNYDYSTAADLEIDRSYNILNVTGGAVTDTIKLPEIGSTADNWDSALTATQCQVGQEFTITNFRSATNLVVAAYNPSSGNSDLINSQTNVTTYSAISMPVNSSLKFRCVRLASGVGYWYTY